MDNSPRGHRIEKISGNAETIVQRGKTMESLGMQMRESAALLKKIEDGTEGKGYSMEKIKENVNSVHVDLGRAGERYEPSGTAVRKYGEALSTVQPTISGIVDNCERLWTAYQNALTAHSEADSTIPPSDETPEQKAERESATGDLATAKTNAYNAWLAEATLYDTPYDTWDDAYEAAVSGLQKANEDGVEDEWWDNALPAIEIILKVLAAAGIVLAVLALIIGGPIIALLAAIVAIAALALTIFKVASGRGGWQDIAWAVVGVIPFGRLAQLGSVFKGATPVATFLKGFGGDLTGLTGIMQLRTARNLPGLISTRVATNAILNSRGNPVSSAGILRNIGNLGDDIADLGRYGGTFSLNPATMWSRATGGGGANMSTGMMNAFDNYSTNVGNHVDGMLDGRLLQGAQNALSNVDQGANVIDTLAKPGREAVEFFGDVFGGSESDTWQQQLAGSR